MKKSTYTVMLLAMALVAPSAVQAQRTISTDTTQNGGTFVVSPAGALFVSGSSDPLLTLTGGAKTSGIQGGVIVGFLSGEKGRLRLENGSILNDSGIVRLGFSDGSNGMVAVTDTGSLLSIYSNDIYVGSNGPGTLDIGNGGRVTNRSGYVGGYLPGSKVTGTATVSGSGSEWQNDVDLAVGNYGKGILTIQDGGKASSFVGYIGKNPGSIGAVTVTGIGSQWQNKGSINIGADQSTGKLDVLNGALVTSASSTISTGSSATVTGANSQWKNSGDLTVEKSSGTLSVTDYGEVKIAGTLTTSMNNLLGNGKIFANSAFLDDANLSFNGGSQQVQFFGNGGELNIGTGDIGIGNNATSSLSISNGAQLRSSNSTLGVNSGSIGTASVTGAGSEWHNTGDLYVGKIGTGTLTIENGGGVTSHDAYLGYYYNKTGTVIVSGTGSKWETSGQLNVGYYGSGTLTVENGGVITSESGYVSVYGDSTAKVTGAGSRWENSSDLSINGKLVIENGGSVLVGGILTIETFGTLSGNGGTIVGNVISDGLIAPGNSPGVLTIDGDLTSTGIVQIQLAGTGSGLFDQLIVTGALKLGGIVEVDLIDGFNPNALSSFKVLDFAQFTSNGYSFDFSHAALHAGLSWDTSTFETDGTIRVVPEASSMVLAGMTLLAGLVVWRKK